MSGAPTRPFAVLGLQLCQKVLPLNPQGLDNVPFALALNTAMSLVGSGFESTIGDE